MNIKNDHQGEYPKMTYLSVGGKMKQGQMKNEYPTISLIIKILSQGTTYCLYLFNNPGEAHLTIHSYVFHAKGHR